MTFSGHEHKALAIIPKVTSLVSIIALVNELLCIISDRENLQKMYQRLVLGMSIVDLVRTVNFFVGTWFVPQHTGDDSDMCEGIGSITTCNIQGFISQIGLAVPLYGAALCVYAFLIIRNNFQVENIASVEKWLHGISLSLPSFLAIALVASQSATPSGSWCWLPPVSLQDTTTGSFVTLFTAAFILFSFIIGVVMITCILMTENKKETDRKEWKGKKKFMETARSIKAHHVTNQAFMHLLTLMICNLFVVIIPMINIQDKFVFLLVGNVLITLSGFFNAMVYTKLLNISKPLPVSDVSPSYSIREFSVQDLPFVTHGFNPCKKISSTFGNMFVLNDEKYRAEDFAVFTGDPDDEAHLDEKSLSSDISVTTVDVESVDISPSKTVLDSPTRDKSYLGFLI